MVKYFFLFLLFITVSVQAQFVVDGHNISERYFVFHAAPIGFLTEDLEVLNAKIPGTKNYYYFYSDPYSIPFDFLLNEDEKWVLRTWTEIDLSLEENQIIAEYYRNSVYENSDTSISRYSLKKSYPVKILDTILRDISIQYLTIYTDDHFQYKKWEEGDYEKIADSLKGKITHIRLKTDWNYNKKTGEFIPYIIGMGLCTKDENSKIKERIWLYYPEIRWSIQSSYYYEKKHQGSFHDYFTKRHFRARVYKKEMIYNDIYYGHHREHNTDSYHQDHSELLALFEIELLKDEVRYSGKDIFNGVFSYENELKEKTEGNFRQSFMQGTWTIYYPGKKKKLELNFESGIPHGKYISFWENGKIKETGEFQFGKKEGNWKHYNEKGVLLSDMNFKSGWMDGAQKTFYPNGKIHQDYFYSDFIINGKYNCYYDDGLLMYSGEMKKGFIIGQWKYNIKVNKEFIELVNTYAEHMSRLTPEVVKDGIVSFTIYYRHEYHKELWYGFNMNSAITGKFE